MTREKKLIHKVQMTDGKRKHSSPQDRKSTFEPQVVQKNSRKISRISTRRLFPCMPKA